MSTQNLPFVSHVRLIWQLILLGVGSVITLVIVVRGELFQIENLFSSIFIGLGGIATILTLQFLIDRLRQRELGKFNSILFRFGLLFSTIEVLSIIYMVNPPIGIIDLMLLIVQSFILSAFIYSLRSKLILTETHIKIVSTFGFREILWGTISSIRWVDKSTVAILAAEYPKEIFIPIFTYAKRGQLLSLFHKKIDSRIINTKLFLKTQ